MEIVEELPEGEMGGVKYRRAKVRCGCGMVFVTANPEAENCGCVKRVGITRHVKEEHLAGIAHRGGSIYNAWVHMRRRSRDRGEHVAPEWQNVEQFGADVGSKPENSYLKMIDPELGWIPGNTKWQPRKGERKSNMRASYTYKGFTWSLYEIHRHFSPEVNVNTLDYRLRSGYSIEEAIEKPTRQGNYGKRK